MSSNETSEDERRGPSGLTVLELAELLPLLEPLPLPPVVEFEPPPTLWRVIPRLLFYILFGTLATVHAGIFLLRTDPPFNQAKCADLLDSSGAFAIAAVLCALGGAGLLSTFKQLMRERRNTHHGGRLDSSEAFRSPGPG